MTKMPTGGGDMGTRSSEETLKKSTAAPSVAYALGSGEGHVPNMGKACKHVEMNMKPAGSTLKDCY